MPKRFSKRTFRLARLAVALQADVEKYAKTATDLGRTSDQLTVHTAAVLAYLNSSSVAAAARELEAKVVPVHLSKFEDRGKVPKLMDEEDAALTRITTSGQFTLAKTLGMYAGMRPTTENSDDDTV